MDAGASEGAASPRRYRSGSPKTRLTASQRSRWRSLGGQLDKPLLEALVADAEDRKALLKCWAAAHDPSLVESEVTLGAVVDWMLYLRLPLLRDLVAQFIRLQERDTDRVWATHAAALAFHEEFIAALHHSEVHC